MSVQNGVGRVVRVLRPLQDFLRTEAAAGVLLLAMVPIALLWANGPFSASYTSLWHTELGFELAGRSLHMDLREWVNQLLMALFFYVVALEIKREMVDGHLREPRKALTPMLAALGGMVVPALVYAAFNVNTSSSNGWAIPMATDIAIVVGFLSFLGNRIPYGLKVFLLTLAIVDDIGAIVVIALFYSGDQIQLGYSLLAVACCALFYALYRVRMRQPIMFVVVVAAAWLATLEAGIHATLIGVVLAFLTPASPIRSVEYIDADALADISSVEAASETVTLARESISSVEWMQHIFHPWSSYLVLPLFALANAGIMLDGDTVNNALHSSATTGTALALLIGKPVGVFLATFLAVKLTKSRLPEGVRLYDVAAGSILTGIGFTVSLFIADLAFTEPLSSQAKTGVLAASFASGALGFLVLRFTTGRTAH